jgi:hypothetical protein
MAGTPLGAIQEIMAIATQDDLQHDTEGLRRRLQAAATYPIFQGMPDGSKEWRSLDDDVKDLLRVLTGPSRRQEILSADVVVETDDLVAFLLRTESFGEGDASIGRYRLLYCVARCGEEWKLAWRQWVGAG